MQTRPAQRSNIAHNRTALTTMLLLLRLSNRVSSLINKALGSHDLQRVVNGVQLGPRRAVRVEVVVAPREVLAVVDGEVHVVQRVVGRAVDELLGPVARDHVAIVDEDGPDLHRDEEHHVQVPVHGADEDEGAGHVLARLRWLVDQRTGMAATVRSRQEGGKQAQPMV
jgi:hypothetical protein